MAFPFKGHYKYTSDTTGKLPWHPCTLILSLFRANPAQESLQACQLLDIQLVFDFYLGRNTARCLVQYKLGQHLEIDTLLSSWTDVW